MKCSECPIAIPSLYIDGELTYDCPLNIEGDCHLTLGDNFTCPDCGGSGNDACAACDGTGIVPNPNAAPFSDHQMITCQTCNGSGEVNGQVNKGGRDEHLLYQR